MEFNQGEFDSVTQRLEQYASQVSVLQTKLEMQPEIESLKKKMNIIQAELDKVKAERDELAEKYEAERQRREVLEGQMTTAAVENAWLKNCILLSLTNIRTFMRMVKRIELKSVIVTFLHKTILPDMGPRGIQAIDETIELTDIGELEKLADQIFMDNHGTVNNV